MSNPDTKIAGGQSLSLTEKTGPVHLEAVSIEPIQPNNAALVIDDVHPNTTTASEEHSKKVAPAKLKKEFEKNEVKWGRPMIDAGWTLMPNTLLERQQALGLDAIDINILLHIMRHWWKADEKPFPSKATIAGAVGVTPRTVQRRIAAMEAHGFIRRTQKKYSSGATQSNYYDFEGLIKAATPYAEEIIALREDYRRKKERRLTKKGRPEFNAVDPASVFGTGGK